MEKLTKTTIKIFIIYVTVSLMFGCVTKKKFKESQELQSTYILDQTEKKWTNSVQNIKEELSTSILSKFNETIKSFKESSTTNENEKTDILVNIKAEDGKEKSATIGNTTVTSNGADISVKTTSNKSADKKLETLNSEWSQKYSLLESTVISLTNEFNEFKTTQLKINEELKAEKKTQTKETNKTSLPIWMKVGFVILALLVLLWLFGGKIPIVARVKGWL